MKSLDQAEIQISQQDLSNYKRLDKFLSDKIASLSRTFIKQLFEDGHIKASLNNQEIKIDLKKMPKLGSLICIEIPEAVEIDAKPENIPLDILFEDDHLIIINKHAGLVVHPAPGNYSGTLVNAILYHCPSLEGIGNAKRPGIVHRLDKGTTGIMVVAKTNEAMEGLSSLFANHDIIRKYQALCLGTKMAMDGDIKTLLSRNPNNRLKMTSKTESGKNAITHYKTLNIFDTFSHLELTLHTGRTHQIRVHLSECLNAAILCDETYGVLNDQKSRLNKNVQKILKNYHHPLLHAKTLGFIHPITKKEMLFEAEPPAPFSEVLALMENIEK